MIRTGMAAFVVLGFVLMAITSVSVVMAQDEQAPSFGRPDTAGQPAPGFSGQPESHGGTASRTFRSPGEVFTYLGILVGVLAVVIVFVSRSVEQPARITVVPQAQPGSTVENVSDFMRETTERLGAMGFRAKLDFTVPELPHRGFYRWMCTVNGDHTVLLAEVETNLKTQAKAKKQYVAFIEFQTVLDNGCKVNTNNSPVANPLKPPPNYLVTGHSRVSVPQDLFNIHQDAVAWMISRRGGRIVPQRVEDFRSDFMTEWRELMQYQVSLGLVKRQGGGSTVRGTPALVMRALAPRNLQRPKVWWAFPVPVMGALAIGVTVWAIPQLARLLGLESSSLAVKGAEAYAVLLLSIAAGYIVGTGGALVGMTCYVPVLALFQAGPVGHVLLLFLSLCGGGLGEKLRNRQPYYKYPWHTTLAPELYLAAVLLIVAAW